MNEKHTPTPWAKRSDGNAITIYALTPADEQIPICTVHHQYVEEREAEANADAILRFVNEREVLVDAIKSIANCKDQKQIREIALNILDVCRIPLVDPLPIETSGAGC